MNHQNLQQKNGVISDQNKTDYGKRNNNGSTILHQVFVIIQMHIFLEQEI